MCIYINTEYWPEYSFKKIEVKQTIITPSFWKAFFQKFY